MKTKKISLPKYLLRTLESKRNIISKERDQLREVMDEIEGLVESADYGLQALDVAIAHFSEQA